MSGVVHGQREGAESRQHRYCPDTASIIGLAAVLQGLPLSRAYPVDSGTAHGARVLLTLRQQQPQLSSGGVARGPGCLAPGGEGLELHREHDTLLLSKRRGMRPGVQPLDLDVHVGGGRVLRDDEAHRRVRRDDLGALVLGHALTSVARRVHDQGHGHPLGRVPDAAAAYAHGGAVRARLQAGHVHRQGYPDRVVGAVRYACRGRPD